MAKFDTMFKGKSLPDLQAMSESIGNALKRFVEAGNVEQTLTYGKAKAAVEKAIEKASKE